MYTEKEKKQQMSRYLYTAPFKIGIFKRVLAQSESKVMTRLCLLLCSEDDTPGGVLVGADGKRFVN